MTFLIINVLCPLSPVLHHFPYLAVTIQPFSATAASMQAPGQVETYSVQVKAYSAQVQTSGQIQGKIQVATEECHADQGPWQSSTHTAAIWLWELSEREG